MRRTGPEHQVIQEGINHLAFLAKPQRASHLTRPWTPTRSLWNGTIAVATAIRECLNFVLRLEMAQLLIMNKGWYFHWMKELVPELHRCSFELIDLLKCPFWSGSF